MAGLPTLRLSLTGDKQLLRRLKAIEPKLRKRSLTRAARIAMKPLLAKAKANAPKQSGALRKSIRLRAMKRNRRGVVGVHISTGEHMFKDSTFYGAFQEFGWHAGKRPSGLRSRGKWSGVGTEQDKRPEIEGRHYIENAYSNGKQQASRTFVEEVEHQLHLIAQGG